jgi:predicted adenylyl cyclase CyaB
MREVELKSIVEDVSATRRIVEKAGGILLYEGKLIDLRYGDESGALLRQDHVVRVRVYEGDGDVEGHLDWKGPTHYEDGYKVREEITTSVGDPDALARILENLGLHVVRDIERTIAQYSLEGAVVRFEEYPRMDSLVEVEGEPDAIERAIRALGLERKGFTSERLPDFVSRFEARTGQRAALTARELAGSYRFRPEDA